MRIARRELLALFVATPAALHARRAMAAADAPPPLSARYAVSTLTKPGARMQQAQWTLHRSADQVALLKGAIDEVWSRDPQGRVSFQRVFHDHAKVADYSAGELATLGVAVDWNTLATLVDGAEMAALKPAGRSGSGDALRWRLQGLGSSGERLRIDWLPALQLPALLLRTWRDGTSTRIELLAHASAAPADWPQPGARSAAYLHLDAADFGDMDAEPVVRLSEALDVRSGWRKPHAHD